MTRQSAYAQVHLRRSSWHGERSLRQFHSLVKVQLTNTRAHVDLVTFAVTFSDLFRVGSLRCAPLQNLRQMLPGFLKCGIGC
jgi:hypothetical protein